MRVGGKGTMRVGGKGRSMWGVRDDACGGKGRCMWGVNSLSVFSYV